MHPGTGRGGLAGDGFRNAGLAGHRHDGRAAAKALRAAGQSGQLVGARIAIGVAPAART
ncbi:hypothetical protein [Streptomyces sp. NBC_00151]|uniref:hypothetical protein n=1 Tax=Streptomyces sp. NBC_00151 TaxID=2975669 RepID=UPI002DDC4C06|nr:hypothetical protein [Streptomyces sp. NBC_00151]WRZ44588.1 hypothetical protein OG915_45315 [Streptomyces sp. NBC_00151]